MRDGATPVLKALFADIEASLVGEFIPKGEPAITVWREAMARRIAALMEKHGVEGRPVVGASGGDVSITVEQAPRPLTVLEAMSEASDWWAEVGEREFLRPRSDVAEARAAFLRMRGWRTSDEARRVWLPPEWAGLMQAPVACALDEAWEWQRLTDDQVLLGEG